ncbi:mucin-2-like [Sardina pilchardus]|uniref:mucin-2-like n=1 Tax=Sardina pilchardus TaxID=27697 RepID=UPI002E0FA1C7
MHWTAPRLWALLWTLTYAAQVDAKLVRSYNHVKSICSMWGEHHYKTFDGDVYQFPGMCDYNLASDCHSSFQDFSVHVKKNMDNKGKITVSQVMVTIKDLPIHLTKQMVMVGGEMISTPYHVSGVLIEENSAYTNLHYKLGLSVMWNRDDAVMVELDSKYSNRTCGLCGDYNGVPIYDEFIHQGRHIGAIEFGNKQRIHNPNVECEDPYEEDVEEDEQQQQQQQEANRCVEAQSSCARRLLSSAWASCASVLDPSPYISACAMDLCHQPTDGSAMCATLAEYSRQCSHARGTPPNWRTDKFCAIKCPYNMVYLESGSPCMTTCTHLESNSLCEEHNIDGCFCPEGTVYDDLSKRGCIPKEQCQCKHDRIYDNGEVLRTDTEECACHEGRWSCKSHAKTGTCAVEEGSHVTTYDGKTYNYHGNCFYVLSKDCVDSKFSILGELAPCSSQDWDTCLKRVVLRLLGDKKNDIVIQANGKVYHNAEVNLPYTTGDVTIFQPSSFHIILQTHLGLQLQIQLVPIMQLYISLDEGFKTKTCGLCGNYNMVLSDELRSPQGMVEGTAASFANSWKAQGSCTDTPDRLEDPCSLSVDNENFAEHWCSLLKMKESNFSKCHSAVNPEIYYKRCKYASCTCDKSEECLCAVVSSYVRACATKGIFLLGWRDTVCNKYTDHCPATQTFSYQLQGCQRTCRSLSSDRQACSPDYLPVDGCACPEGLYLDDSGMCVAMNKCPCLHNGDYIKPGKSITVKEEHCVCTNGKLHCRSWRIQARGEYLGLDHTSEQDDKSYWISTECESGCRCPDALLDDGRGNCVQEHDCPCHHNGHYYASGSQIPLNCNNCTCNSGKWICSDNVCSSTCTIYGSGHYQTFDDQRFGFNGDCGYVAVQDRCGSQSGNFHVITENVPCGTTGTTCSKSVRIVLGRTELKLSDGAYDVLDLGEGPDIKYTVRHVGLYLVVESVIGFTAFWDRKTTVRVILQPEHTGKVCGLCGNFNGDGQDDFTTQNQLLVSNVLEFANSWKVSSSCPDAEDNFDPCSKNPSRHTWAKMQCSIIKGETFKNCHAMVDPSPYYENCVKDSCACDNGGDCECFCTAVAAYAQACNEAGVCVAWRTPDICPVYCDYYNGPAECTWHYSPCHTPCYKTCLHPDGICSNPLPNLEGCYPVCPPDKPIFDEGQQICVEECEGCCCMYNGTEYEEGEVIYDVTDNMGMCYKAICINETVIHTNEPCETSTTPPTPPSSTTTEQTTTTPETPSPPTSTTTTGPTPSTTTTGPTPSTTPCVEICDWTEWTPTINNNNRTSTINYNRTPTINYNNRANYYNPFKTFSTYINHNNRTPTVIYNNRTPTINHNTRDPHHQQQQQDLHHQLQQDPHHQLQQQGKLLQPLTPTINHNNRTSTINYNRTSTINHNNRANYYNPCDYIYDKHPIGSGICLTMICSGICEIKNSTGPCVPEPSTTTPTPTVRPTPPVPECPEWDKVQNETFWICECVLARCIEDNIIEIIPYECPPLETITCANGKEPVLVWDEKICCQKYACDCYCEGWGDPHYVTFDGLSYSHQGNCTYVLMEEIHPVFDFKIYVDNVKCDPTEDVSCPRSIIISHKSDVITLKNNNLMGPAKLEALKDGASLKLPYSRNGIRVSNSGLKMIYEIPMLEVAVTFGIVGFSVSLPYKRFGNNTQGHCGTCNNNPHDDCRLPDGRLIENCAIMADFWPAQDVYRPDCPVPDVVPTGAPIPLPTHRPCNEHVVCDLIKSDLFAACHPHISPDRFFDGCVFDSCHMENKVVECTSLQVYAEACAQIGVCVHWRNHTTLCPSNCDDDKVYKPCGPAEQPTCDSDPSEPGMNIVIEGCFCPEGTKLFSKESRVCVDRCGCLDADGVAREFNERFEYKCQDCVCEEDTRAVTCKPKQCPPPSVISCTQPGFALVNSTDPANPCCQQLSCRCDSSLCPTPNKCPLGYESEITLTEGGCCQDITCEPKSVCIHKGAEYKPGDSVPVVDCQECRCTTLKDPNYKPFLQVNCKMVECNEDCEHGYTYHQDYYDYEACCGECIQTHCSFNASGTAHLLEPGSTWPSPDNKCVTYHCSNTGGKFIVTKSEIQCPPFKESNCQPGTIQTLSNGCCQVCEPKDTGCQVETVPKTISYKGCQSQDEVDMAYCEGSCNAFSKYSELEASMKHTCTCCRESKTSNRTVTLTCLDGTQMPYTYTHVEQCECSNKLCDEGNTWATRTRGPARTTARRRMNTGVESPIVKRSVLDRGG